MASYTVKLILLGDSGTGKTSLLNKFVNNVSPTEHETTIGVDFEAKSVRTSSDTIVRLHMWDTAGQEHFRSIVSAYYKCIAGAFILFNVTDRKSFTNSLRWLTELRESNEHGDTLPIILLGNKTDSKNREVSFKEAYDFSSKHGVRYYDISVKENIGINEAIIRIIDDIEYTFILPNKCCKGIRYSSNNHSKINLKEDSKEKSVIEKYNCCIQS